LKVARSQRQVRVEYRDSAETLIGKDFPLDGLAGNHDFLRLLRDEQVETLHSKEASLDDVFVEATGRTLA
jgi:fluoroquinolone transport system ATP-binding protein